jgi:thioredoxin-related protein
MKHLCSNATSGATAPDVVFRLAAVLLVLGIYTAAWSTAFAEERERRDAREYFFTQTFGDLPEELQAARDSDKLGMVLFFEAESCPYCQHMIRKVFSDREVQDWYGERFVSIAIDIHGDVEMTDFDGITLPSKIIADHRRVFLTPVMTFVDLEGNEVYRHLGMIRTPEEMLVLGEYIAGKHHYLMEYRTYAEKRGMQDEEGALMTPAGESE